MSEMYTYPITNFLKFNLKNFGNNLVIYHHPIFKPSISMDTLEYTE